MTRIFRYLAAGLMLAAPLSGQATHPASVDVPIRKVMLFSSGVGYFEHAGTVRGNGATDLRFKTAQINDILKSLVLQDQDGGRVGAITYPSQDPLAKTLRSFQVDITQNPSLAQLLNQLRGARVSLVVGTERLAGTILGVETRTKAGDKSTASSDTPVLNLLAGATIRAVELPAVTSLSLEDAQLQEELTKALGALVQARDQDKKPVTINFTGAGDRRVRIGYVVETPVWKTSYRLLFDDKGSRGRIQGWAIVENQTDSDWNDVSLSLVSGRPISFTMDLYQPLYATRPVVAQEQFAGLRPQVYEGGLSNAAAPASAPARIPPGQRRIGYDANGNPIQMQLNEVVVTGVGDERSPELDAASSVASMASTGRLGELFQYAVPDVTLARQKSAMLPIVTDTIEAERVSIYNRTVLLTNPLNGVRIRNTTGKHLLQGPVTVLDGAGYAGDARIDNLPPGQERLLSYGIDLDAVVDVSKSTTSSSIRTARIDHGVLSIQRKMEHAQDYTVQNKGARDKTIVIEHPFRQGSKLTSAVAPFETTPTVQRFKLSVAAGKTATLAVREEMITGEGLGLAAADLSTLLMYSTTTAIPSSVRDAIVKAIDLKRAIDDANAEVARRVQQINEITTEQNRIRENMKTIAPTTPYYTRLLEKLNDQESSIERLQRERDDWTAKREEARRQLDAYLKDLVIG